MADINSPRKTRSGRLLGGVTHGGGVENPGNAIVEVRAVEEIVREETVADIIDLTEDYIDVDDDDAFGDLLGDVTGTTNNEDNAEDRNITIVNDDTQTDDTTDNVIGEEGAQGNEDIAQDVNNLNDSVEMLEMRYDGHARRWDMMATLGDGTGATINEDNAGDGTITIVDDDTPTDETTDDAAGEDRIQGTVHDVTVDLTDSPLPTSSSTVFTLPGTGRDVQSRPQIRIFGSTSSPTSGAPLPSTSSSSMPSKPSTSGASVSSTSGASSTAASTSSAGVICRICLESQSDLEKEGLNLLSTVCGHIFCSKCLPSYIKNKGLCPICRKVLRPKDFHQIFL